MKLNVSMKRMLKNALKLDNLKIIPQDEKP